VLKIQKDIVGMSYFKCFWHCRVFFVFFSLFAVLTSESKYMYISSKYMYTIRKENLVLQRQPGLTFLSSHNRNDTQVLVAPVDQR